MTVVHLITVGELKKLLEPYDDDAVVSFGDYDFQRLYQKYDNEVEIKLNPISDYELGLGETDPND